MLKLIIPAKLNEQTICAVKWKGKDTKVSFGNRPVQIRMPADEGGGATAGKTRTKKSGHEGRFFEQQCQPLFKGIRNTKQGIELIIFTNDTAVSNLIAQDLIAQTTHYHPG